MNRSTVTANVTTTVDATTLNATLDTSTGRTWEPPYNTVWVIASATILFSMTIFGAVANGITIAVIKGSSKLRSIFYIFIMSLCISDLISAAISPLFLYRRTWGFDYFGLPDFFCKLYFGMDFWTSFVTALHILSFALLRFIGVMWPTTFKRISSKGVLYWALSIWIIAFFVGFLPRAIFNEVKVIDRSSNKARWASCGVANRWFDTWKIYIKSAYPIFLYAPAIVVLIISIAIAVKLRCRRIPGDNTRDSKSYSMKKRKKKDRTIILQLGLIVGSFLLGYAPLTAYHFYTGIFFDEDNPEELKIDWQFAMMQYILLRFSECLNPIFYNLASRKMRNETFKLLKLRSSQHPTCSHRNALNSVMTSGVC